MYVYKNEHKVIEIKIITSMRENSSNSTKANTVDTILTDSNTVCTLIVFISVLGLSVLSFIWSVHLVLSVIKERKNQKYLKESKNSIQREVWNVKIKNSERKIIKYAFLIAICIFEWITMLTFCFTLAVGYSRGVVSSKNFEIPSPDFRENLIATMQCSFSGKLLISFILVLFSLILILLRILTQYLCQEYCYFPSSFKLAAELKRVLFLLLVIFVLGLFRSTIILQWTLYCIVMLYEFVCFFKATKLLINLLYKRYFDAKNHENQTNSVVTYYARVYLEFKIGSCFVVTSFFFQVVSWVSFIIYSFLWFFLTTDNWLQVILMNKRRLNYIDLPLQYYQQIDSFREIYRSLELVSLALGWSLLVIPYFIVSLTVLYRRNRNSFNKHEYQNPELIKALIDKHNRDYYFR